MKTFKDLTFEAHPSGKGKQAILQFDNGRAVSVIADAWGRCSWNEDLYDVALIKKDGRLGCVYLDRDSASVALAEDRPYNDVAGYCTEDEVTLIMKTIQTL